MIKPVLRISLFLFISIIMLSSISFADVNKEHWAFNTLNEFIDKGFVDESFSLETLNDFINKRRIY